MTERVTDNRWELAIEQLTEMNARYLTLVRMVQHGLGSVSGEVAEARRDLVELQRTIATMRQTEQECFVRLVRLESDGAHRMTLIRYLLALTTAMVLVLLASFVWQLVTL